MLLGDFPIATFDASDSPQTTPVLGLRVVSDEASLQYARGAPPRSGDLVAQTLDYLGVIGLSALGHRERSFMTDADFARTITITVDAVHPARLDDTDGLYASLISTGQRSAQIFLPTWSYRRYLDVYHSGPTVFRRDRVARAMQSGSAAAR
jgi:hypothetical protein